MKNKANSEKRRMWRLAGKYSSFGIELTFCIIVPTGIGNWVDDRYGVAPYGFYIGAVVGLGAVFESVRRLVVYTKKNSL
tara:strand:+ start:458 stop:694 length:237 start_codon:yes stop_codon:yes gene_type:complete